MKLDLGSIRRKKDQQKSIPLGEAILVDLTPPSHREFVELRRLKKHWIYGLFGVMIFCIAASLLAVGLNAQTEGVLSSERNTQLLITKDTAKYAEINSALELEKIAIDSLNIAAGSEINWSRLISNIEGTLPSGTQISAISVTGGGELPKEGDKPGVAAVVNLNLSSASTLGYSDSLKKIEAMTGIDSVEISGLKTESGRYNYTLSFSYDTSLLTGNYSLKEKK